MILLELGSVGPKRYMHGYGSHSAILTVALESFDVRWLL